MQNVGFEYLHLLLCLSEFSLAILRKLQAAFVRGEGLLQGQLTRFHAADELFQLGHRGFETERPALGGGRLWRSGHKYKKGL